MLKVSYIKIYKCKNRYREREPRGVGALCPLPGGASATFPFFILFCVCGFFFYKKTPNKNKIPAGSRVWKSSGMERGLSSSSEGFWHLQPLPPVLALLELLPGEGAGEGGGKLWGWGGGAPAPKMPGFIWECPGAGGIWGPPLQRGHALAPKWEQGNSWSPPAPPRALPPPPPHFHSRGHPRTPTLLGPSGLPRSCCWGTTPHFPPSGDPRAPSSPDVSGAGRGGCGRKNGKDRALPRQEEHKTLWGFFPKLSLFPTPFFCLFSGATSSGATTKSLSVPRVPAVLPPRSRPAELRTFSFFPIIIINIINSNAGCKKQNQLSPPEEAPVVPPRAVSRPLCPRPSQGAAPLPRDREPRQENGWKKTRSKEKNIKTTPAKVQCLQGRAVGVQG